MFITPIEGESGLEKGEGENDDQYCETHELLYQAKLIPKWGQRPRISLLSLTWDKFATNI